MLMSDQQFAALFPKHGQPAEAPWRLALVTLPQVAENLSDRRAADAARSRIDWDAQLATCPAGHTSQSWTAGHNQDRTVTRIHFSTTDCKACALKPRCTRASRRLLTPRRREEHDALQAARARETGKAFAAGYRRRAGIEGTLSQGTRTLHLRRSRYIGLAKTHLQHVLTAAAINLGRVSNWLAGAPRERTRQSAFVRLMATPAAA